MWLCLRLLAIAGIVMFIANLQLRSETQITRSSRLALLVDTSLSMGLRDQAVGNSMGSLDRRIDEVVESLKSQPTLAELCREHDVAVYEFGGEDNPKQIASFGRTGKDETEFTARALSPTERLNNQLENVRPLRWALIGFLVLFVLSLIRWIRNLKSDESPETRGLADLPQPHWLWLSS